MWDRPEKVRILLSRTINNYDYSWEVLRFPRIILFGIAPKKYEYFYPGQLTTMSIAGRCFNFQGSCYLGSPWKVRILLSKTINNYDYSWEVLQFARVMLCRITLKKYEYFHPGRSATMIIAERCFNFQGLCYLGSPWKTTNTSIQDNQKLWL